MKHQTLTKWSDKLLSLLYRSLFIVTPLLVYHKTSELFEFNKILFVYLIAGLIASLWVFKMLLFRKIILKKTPIDLFILLFVATQILSTIFSIDQHTSIFGYYGRFNGGLLSTFSYILLYYGFTSQIGTIFTRAWVIKTMKISLIVAIGVVVWGLTGWIGKDASCALFTGVWTNACWTADFKPALRMFSTLGQPNWLGAYIAVNISYCLYFLKNSFDKNKKLIHSGSLINGGILFLLYGAVFATKSRSAMLATAFVTVYFVGVQYIAKRGFPKPDVKLFTRQCTLIASIGLMAMIVFKTGVPLVDKITHPWTLFTHETLQQTQPIKQERKLFISKSSDIRRIVWRGAIPPFQTIRRISDDLLIKSFLSCFIGCVCCNVSCVNNVHG